MTERISVTAEVQYVASELEQVSIGLATALIAKELGKVGPSTRS